MSPKDLKELKRLLAAWDDPTEEEENRLGNLLRERHKEQVAMVVTPQCCETSKKYGAITFRVTLDDNVADSRKWKGRWHIQFDKELSYLRFNKRDYSNPEPVFCPFCGTRTPKMKRKVPFPKRVSYSTDGNSCDICHEDQNCICDPPATAFEPEGP